MPRDFGKRHMLLPKSIILNQKLGAVLIAFQFYYSGGLSKSRNIQILETLISGLKHSKLVGLSKFQRRRKIEIFHFEKQNVGLTL